MFVKETGNKNKPLMVLLHGGGVAGWMWKAQEEYFINNWHILIPDLPGHGQSAEEKFVSIEDCADKVIKLIREKKEGKRAVIMGLSLGAQIAVEIMSRRENAADAAVIQSALVIPMHITRKFLKPLVKYSLKLIKNRKFSKVQAKQLYITGGLFERYYEDSIKMSIDNLFAVLNANMTYQLPLSYAGIEHPMLIMYGKRERNVMVKSAKLLALNPNAEIFCAPNTGHGFSLADPLMFNQRVESWLKTKSYNNKF